tara:strand:+ start:1930 stop:2409 length:480 start_codon:yes stop_codon:yes gene_type:complete
VAQIYCIFVIYTTNCGFVICGHKFGRSDYRSLEGDIMRQGLIATVVLLALFLGQFTGLWVPFLAHPFWASQGALVGGLIGAAAGIVLGQGRVWALWAGLVLLAATGAITLYGKAEFAASYAEDAVAGKIWYFGYFATMAALAFTLCRLLMALKQPDQHD